MKTRLPYGRHPRREIRLSGSLVEACGAEVLELPVSTPADAVQMLCLHFPGARAAIEAHDWRLSIGSRVIDPEEHIRQPMGTEPLSLWAVPAGSGDGGRAVGKLVGGIVLIGLAFFSPVAGLGAQGLFAATGGIGPFLFAAGASFALGGISLLLAPTPPTDYFDDEGAPSFAFRQAVNSTREGVPIPVLFGRFLAGSVVASVGITNRLHQAVDGTQSIGTVRIVDVVSEGPIEDLSTVYLDRVAESDTSFAASIDRRLGYEFGDERQTPISRLDSIERPITDGLPVEVKIATGSEVQQITGQWDSARLTIGIPQLWQTSSSTGGRIAKWVEFRVEVQPNGGDYAAVTSGLIVRGDGDPSRVPYHVEDVGLWQGYVPSHQIRITSPRFNASSPPRRVRVAHRIYQSSDPFVWGEWITLENESFNAFGRGEYVGSIRGEPVYPTDFALHQWETIAEYDFNTISRGGGIPAVQLTSCNVNLVNAVDYYRLYDEISDSNFRIDVPFDLPEAPGGGSGSPWNIRVTRVTPDDVDDPDQPEASALFWTTTTTVLGRQLAFPNLAYTAMDLSAEAAGGRVPSRQYAPMGVLCTVPDGYEADGSYPDPWNGEWLAGDDERIYTTNPAWCLLEYLTNERWGMGIPIARIDGDSLFECGRYSDSNEPRDDDPAKLYGRIPTGNPGDDDVYVPRFSFNYWVATSEEPLKLAASIASAARILIFPGLDGRIYFGQDRPRPEDATTERETSTRILNATNVKDGAFRYSSVPRKQRFSSVAVTYWDSDDFWERKTEIVEDPELLARWGRRRKNVTAIGCSFRHEARRRGRFELESAKLARVMETTVSVQDVAAVPGDVVDVHDAHLAGARYGGRILIGTAGALLVDGDVALNAGEAYWVSAQLPDGTVEERPVVTATPYTGSVLTVSPDFSAAPNAGVPWFVAGSDLEGLRFRILLNRDAGDGEYGLTGVRYGGASFYDAIDYGEPTVDHRTPIIENRWKGLPLEVPSISVDSYPVRRYGSRFAVVAQVGWSRVEDPRVGFYEVRWRDADGNASSWILTSRAVHHWEFDAASTYTFEVRSVTADLRSRGAAALVTEQLDPLSTFSAPPATPSGLLDDNATAGKGRLYWNRPTELDVVAYEVRHSGATTTAAARWDTAAHYAWIPYVPEKLSDALSRIYLELPYARDGVWLVKAVDVFGKKSALPAKLYRQVTSPPTPAFAWQEHPGWAGVKVNTVKVGSNLQLSAPGGVFPGIGFYFPLVPTVDLGSVQTRHLTGQLSGGALRNDYFMASWNPLASVEAMSGTVNHEAQYETHVLVSFATKTAPAAADWTPWEIAYAGPYTFRHIKVAIGIYNWEAQPGVSPDITEFFIFGD